MAERCKPIARLPRLHHTVASRPAWP